MRTHITLAGFQRLGLLRSFQRGSFFVASATTNTATIASVNRNHALLRYSGVTNSGLCQSDVGDGTLTFNSDVQIQVTRASADANSLTLSWEIIEFFPGIIKKIQRGTITYSAEPTTVTINFVRMDRAHVDKLGMSYNYASYCTYMTTYLNLESATTVRVRSGAFNSQIVAYQVVEYRQDMMRLNGMQRFGIVKSIQRGVISVSSSQTADATISPVNLANSLLKWLGGANGGVCQEDVGAAWLQFTNNTTVRGQRVSTSANAAIVSWEVIEYYPGVLRKVQRGTITYAGALANATISVVDINKAGVDNLGFQYSGTSNCSYIRPVVNLTSSTNVQSTASAYDTQLVSYQVAEYD